MFFTLPYPTCAPFDALEAKSKTRLIKSQYHQLDSVTRVHFKSRIKQSLEKKGQSQDIDEKILKSNRVERLSPFHMPVKKLLQQ